MAFNNLGLQEPSTITARVATVTIQRGSTLEHQEILVLGDATSSLAVAQVTNAAPSTSAYGLAVRQVDAVQSAQSGAWTVRATLSSTGTDNPVTAAQSGTWTVRANVSSTAADNPVTASQAGTWNIGTVTAVTGKVSVINSSAADLNVTVAGYSTTVNVSSVAGIVAVRPSDTNWASSAGFHFNSSGELLTVAAASAASTTVNVSSLAGRVGIAGYHASGSLVNVTDSTNNAINVNVVAGSAAGSTVATISRFQDSSNNGIAVADSVNNALRVNVVAGAAGGSTIVTISTVQGTVNVFPASTGWAAGAGFQLNSSGELRVAEGPESTTVNISSLAGNVRVVNSSAADLLASVAQTSTVWAVQAAQVGSWTVAVSNPASTTVNVSSVAGTVSVQQVSTVWAVQLTNYSTIVAVSSVAGKVSVVNSSAADLDVAISDGLGNALESSTQIASSNARGLIVRPVIVLPQTYSASTTGQSSATTIFTSNATVRPYVFAYSITSTLNGPVYWSIQKGSTRLWGGVLAAISSAISGANLAVSPPGFLFAGSTGRPLSFNVESSNAGLNVSIAYWQCP